MTFGEKLLKLRKVNGMSQDELAIHISVSRQAISRWENGSSLPETETVIQLSKLFDVSIDYLLNDEYSSDYGIPNPQENRKRNNSTIWVVCGVGLIIIGVVALWFNDIAISIINAMPDTQVVSEGALIPIYRFMPIVGVALIVYGIYKSSKFQNK